MKKDFSSMIGNATPDEIDAILQGDIEIDGDVSSDKIRKNVKNKINAGKYAKLRASLAVAASVVLVAAIGVASVVYMVGQNKVEPPVDFTDTTEAGSVYTEITTAETAPTQTQPTESSVHTVSTETAATEPTAVTTEATTPAETTSASTTATAHQPIYELPSEEVESNYKIEYETKYQDNGFSSSVLKMVVNGEERWRVPFKDMLICKNYEVSDGVILCLKKRNVYSSYDEGYYLAKVDIYGQICWLTEMINLYDLKWAYFNYVYEYPDGTYGVIYNGLTDTTKDTEESLIGFSVYSNDGLLIYNKTSRIKMNLTVSYVKRTSNGFAVANLGYVFDDLADTCSKIVCIDDYGNITSEFILEYPPLEDRTEDSFFYYTSTSMIEYGGKLYISGYYFTEADLDLQWEDFTYFPGKTDFSIENVCGREWRKRFIGFIVRCDFDGGNIEIVYSEKEKQGGNLYTDDDGNLVWEAEQIVSIYRTTSVNILFCGISAIHKYRFDHNMNLIDSEITNNYTRAKVE